MAKSTTFIEIVQAGQQKAERIGESHPLVEAIAKGILSLAAMTGDRDRYCGLRRKHRHVLDLLHEVPLAHEHYMGLVDFCAIDRNVIDKKAWENDWRDKVLLVGQAIVHGRLGGQEAVAFLAWPGKQGE